MGHSRGFFASVAPFVAIVASVIQSACSFESAPVRVPELAGGSIEDGAADSRRAWNSLNRVVLSPASRSWVGRLHWPLDAHFQLGSPFGSRKRSFHEGIDIRAPEGALIRVAHDGTVVYAGSGLNGYGNMIVVQGDDLLTVYAHNRRNLVRRGDRVAAGSVIGTVGKTGRASGTHLHFEIRVRDGRGRDIAVDPLAFFSQDIGRARPSAAIPPGP